MELQGCRADARQNESQRVSGLRVSGLPSKWEPELKLGDSPDVRSEAAASTGTSGPLPGTNTWADGGHVELVSK